jgi:hypothetical protein
MSDSACCEQPSSDASGLDGSMEMTALRAHRQGGPEVLVVERAPIPVPAADEVLVEVHVGAITFDELKWPQTWTRGGLSRTPVILSHEVSGVVRQVGSEVTDSARVRTSADLLDSIATAPLPNMLPCLPLTWLTSRRRCHMLLRRRYRWQD